MIELSKRNAEAAGVTAKASKQLKDAITQEIKVHAELVKAAGLVPQ